MNPVYYERALPGMLLDALIEQQELMLSKLKQLREAGRVSMPIDMSGENRWTTMQLLYADEIRATVNAHVHEGDDALPFICKEIAKAVPSFMSIGSGRMFGYDYREWIAVRTWCLKHGMEIFHGSPIDTIERTFKEAQKK